MKKIWRKNFEIKKTCYQLLAESAESFFVFQKPTLNKYYLKEGVMVSENGDNIGSYFVKNELRDLIKNTLDAIIKNPKRVHGIHEKAIKYNKDFFLELKKAEKINLENLSKTELIKLYKHLFKWLQLGHGYSLPTTWFIDSDGEDLSHYLLDLIGKKVKENKLNISAPEAFSILTTPAQESMAQAEEKEMYAILKFIQENNAALKVFSNKNRESIESNLVKIDKKLRNKIINHFKKWRWMPYTYVGPAYNLDYYLDIWSSLLKQKSDPDEEIKKLELAKKETLIRRAGLIKDLYLSQKEKAIFDLAAEIVWLKGLRKEVSFFGFYVIDKVLKEMGKRAGFSLMQMKYVAFNEMKNFENFSSDELNSRIKFSVIYSKSGKFKIFNGKKAKDFLKKQNFEKIILKDSGELKGTCAYVGRARGAVKIINTPEEMGKMQKGDIMVAHTTFPSLVPAMKKAAAIVTDDGGITCHAAIVARELRTPCIVGTKNATYILKDGDKVEVDAEKGIIKKVNS